MLPYLALKPVADEPCQECWAFRLNWPHGMSDAANIESCSLLPCTAAAHACLRPDECSPEWLWPYVVVCHLKHALSGEKTAFLPCVCNVYTLLCR